MTIENEREPQPDERHRTEQPSSPSTTQIDVTVGVTEAKDQAVSKAGEAVHKNREKIDEGMEKAASITPEMTGTCTGSASSAGLSQYMERMTLK